MNKILVCGSRLWTNSAIIYDVLSRLDKNTVIIHGGAKGADMITHWMAQKLKLKTQMFQADWNNFGKKAGIIRNLQMLDENPNKVIAFYDGVSKGTKHTIEEAEKRGIPVDVIMEGTFRYGIES